MKSSTNKYEQTIMFFQRSKKYINQYGEGSGFVYFLMIMMLVKIIMMVMVKIKMAKDLALFALSSSFLLSRSTTHFHLHTFPPQSKHLTREFLSANIAIIVCFVATYHIRVRSN